ncbi:DUF1844 domain-containing protein [Myxococcus sp. MISCRS1]|jgi:hypothetical protein|uniref:DUF1844 domain-containing protein n=1 Tax=Myxococcus TaxID=32 RepID=UPI001CBFAE9E|nr:MULTISPECIES: DUF1844 domain-containing protein [unclassified Myxococcus]MBZ4398737.1 DUF1844 domain-containing protein [Myxococcus sp. AS-1-15]MBZ4406997.1 DUF1844 domain-containing protein [Myxococcus sp. XM-1-1-1]MCY1002192.1 DUF1844 domain-containing protein [Myxococcus sp. MISCRS1]BDT36236.1 DUF1844 domain-containing protein [Myxococcus sp. MH1]
MSPADEKRGETFVMRGEARSASEEPIGFTTFIMGLGTAVLIYLGDAPNPETGQTTKDLPLARQNLDLLSMLRLKTRGNLTAEEEKLFDGLLADLRLRFVEASKR